MILIEVPSIIFDNIEIKTMGTKYTVNLDDLNQRFPKWSILTPRSPV